jgi:predicted anti-sigma-YlaC factor YlaD
MNCYETIDIMDVALEGKLDAASRPGFDEHLEDCPACRTYFDQLRVTVAALEHLPRQGPLSHTRAELIAAFKRERGAKH